MNSLRQKGDIHKVRYLNLIQEAYARINKAGITVPVSRAKFFYPKFGMGVRDLTFSTVENFSNGIKIMEMQNDRQKSETLNDYIKRSHLDLSSIIPSDTFNIVVHPSRKAASGALTSGHIFVFVVSDSDSICMSLRNDSSATREKEKLYYKLETDPKPRINSVWTVKFYSHIEELEKFFIKKASEGVNIGQDARYIVNVPFNVIPDDILNQKMLRIWIDKFKKSHKDERYILHSGTLVRDTGEEIPIPAFNCVSGVYGALNAKGNEPDPSCQMAAVGILRFLNTGLSELEIQKIREKHLCDTRDDSRKKPGETLRRLA